MVIKRNNSNESAGHDTHHHEVASEKQPPATTELAYRRKLNQVSFEWSKDPLPDLTREEMQAVKALKFSLESARVIKGLMQKGLRYKQIIFHLRGQKGFSISSVSKLHAALSRINKRNQK